MSHVLLHDSRLFALLLRIDHELAAPVRAGRCLKCGGRLDASTFPRQPRGGPPPELAAEYSMRLRFCRDIEGCRTRATPESVRYLGRRVYLGAIVVLVSAIVHGVTSHVDVGVVRGSNEPVAASGEFAIEFVQHDVAEERRERASLRHPFFRPHDYPIRHHHLRREHASDQNEESRA